MHCIRGGAPDICMAYHCRGGPSHLQPPLAAWGRMGRVRPGSLLTALYPYPMFQVPNFMFKWNVGMKVMFATAISIPVRPVCLSVAYLLHICCLLPRLLPTQLTTTYAYTAHQVFAVWWQQKKASG